MSGNFTTKGQLFIFIFYHYFMLFLLYFYFILLTKLSGAGLFSQVASYARNYHNLGWDVNSITDFVNYTKTGKCIYILCIYVVFVGAVVRMVCV